MAIKITPDSRVSKIIPKEKYFDIEEICDEINGWVNPLKIGPVWVFTGEDSKIQGLELNKVASYYFEIPMYGNVVIVPPQELPPNLNPMGEDDEKFTAEQIDMGLLMSLEHFLLNITNSPYYAVKRECYFIPDDDVNEDVRMFYKKSFEYFEKTGTLFEDKIAYEDNYLMIKLKDDEDLISFLNQMIVVFTELEEYEKCSYVKKLIDNYKNNVSKE